MEECGRYANVSLKSFHKICDALGDFLLLQRARLQQVTKIMQLNKSPIILLDLQGMLVPSKDNHNATSSGDAVIQIT